MNNKLDNFKFYAGIRIAAGIFIFICVLWLLSFMFGSSSKDTVVKNLEKKSSLVKAEEEASKSPDVTDSEKVNQDKKTDPDSSGEKESSPDKKAELEDERESRGKEASRDTEKMYKLPADTHSDITGWTFLESMQAPLSYELNERFLGWRPNDIIIGKFTDNVNYFQRGVLEVTRKTAIVLTENISRTGSTSSFNPHLENAMNWFMIKPETFWFPSAESKYKSGLEELVKYQSQLVEKEANFYSRTDSLIPLLERYKNILGSCDDNLVKQYEDNGEDVSFFHSDNYFFYAKGVAKSMAHILKAIEHDFNPVLKNRNGLGSLHHAIESLEKAEKINPMIILDSDLSGFFANHRANLATKISHGRFYLGVLIITLST
ncbi:MAG: DUF2333 family protein [Thermodesulfobacteriota bacterium]